MSAAAAVVRRRLTQALLRVGHGKAHHHLMTTTKVMKRPYIIIAHATRPSSIHYPQPMASTLKRGLSTTTQSTSKFEGERGAAATTGAAGEALTFQKAMDQVKALPEVVEALRYHEENRSARAVPLLQRAIEVMDASMGSSNTLAEAARFQLALIYFEMGEFAQAHRTLEGMIDKLEMGRNAPKDIVTTRLLLAGSFLFQDKLVHAVEHANEALDFVEKQAESYTDLLSRAYSMAGICDLYGGDYEDAYDRLQKAARLACQPAWQCRSSSTLGAFHLYTLKEGGPKAALAVWEETIQGLDRPAEGTDEANEVALAEATLCLNLAEVYLGEKGGAEGAKLKDLAKAEEAASRALKLQEERLAKDDPRMGRTLLDIAKHRHAIGQAVSAEGLFRSALDLLGSPSAKTCPTHRYTLWRAHKGYARLLRDWERRERDAEAEEAKAKETFASLVKLSMQVPISPMIWIEGGAAREVDYW